MHCFPRQTGTLTEEGLDVWGVKVVKGSGFDELVPDPRLLPPSFMLSALASCHSVALLGDQLIGDPLELKMIESTGWVRTTVSNTHMIHWSGDVVSLYTKLLYCCILWLKNTIGRKNTHTDLKTMTWSLFGLLGSQGTNKWRRNELIFWEPKDTSSDEATCCWVPGKGHGRYKGNETVIDEIKI